MIWTWKLDLLFFHVLISPFRSCSALQELRDMLNKQLWVLVLRTMIAVGVQNELRVRQVLLEEERVHRIDDYVVAAVHYERGLSDVLQVSIGGSFAGAPHFCSAATCAGATFSFDKGSRFCLRALCRSRYFLPAAWLCFDGVKKTQSHTSSAGSYLAPKISCASGVSDAIPSPLLWPVPTSMSFRTRSGRSMVNCCATKPPIENPRALSFLTPSASMKAAACCAISSIEVGTSPLELDTPALLNKITSRSWANPSVTAGSQ